MYRWVRGVVMRSSLLIWDQSVVLRGLGSIVRYMISIGVNEISEYDIIHSEVDPALRTARLFILRHEGEVFIGYGTDNEIDQVLSVEEFARVEEATEYSGVTQTYCKYCRDYDRKQLSEDTNMPSLSACSTCHDHLISKFTTLVEENCSEVVASHF